MVTKLLQMIKKYGIPALLVLALVWGVSSLLKNNALYDDLSIAVGKQQAVTAEYNLFRKDAEDRIKHLQKEILEVNKHTAALAKENDKKTAVIQKLKPTITQLENARLVLSDKDAVIVNQDMQILQYKDLVAKQEERYTEAREIVSNLADERNKAIRLAKEYHDLWQKEIQLRQLSEDSYKELASKYKSRGFKITVKGIGEKILFAGLGYGLGRLAN